MGLSKDKRVPGQRSVFFCLSVSVQKRQRKRAGAQFEWEREQRETRARQIRSYGGGCNMKHCDVMTALTGQTRSKRLGATQGVDAGWGIVGICCCWGRRRGRKESGRWGWGGGRRMSWSPLSLFLSALLTRSEGNERGGGRDLLFLCLSDPLTQPFFVRS